MWRSCRVQPSHKERAIGVVCCKKEGMLLQPLRWFCVDCVIHDERDVREEQKYMYVAQTSNNTVFSSGDLYCCLLPQCAALRTCRSGFPIATVSIDIVLHEAKTVLGLFCFQLNTVVWSGHETSRICKETVGWGLWLRFHVRAYGQGLGLCFRYRGSGQGYLGFSVQVQFTYSEGLAYISHSAKKKLLTGFYYRKGFYYSLIVLVQIHIIQCKQFNEWDKINHTHFSKNFFRLGNIFLDCFRGLIKTLWGPHWACASLITHPGKGIERQGHCN